MRLTMWRAATAAVLFLSGCATTPPPDTRSGYSEIILMHVSPECAESALPNALVNDAWTITNSGDGWIAASRKAQSEFIRAMLYTPSGGDPEERVSARVLYSPTLDAVKITVDTSNVSNPGTGFERTFPSQVHQDWLDKMRTALETECKK